MTEFSKIFLSWRRGKGSRRHIVGLLERSLDNQVSFQYLPLAKELKKTEGFIPYFEFQNLDEIYTTNVMKIFSHRLIKSERPDAANFYDFWDIEKIKTTDSFYVLGKSQGLTILDNFEFLADFQPNENIDFVTDLSGLSYLNLLRDTVKSGDSLTYQFESNNPIDSEAVVVKFNGQNVGYIKQIHCKVFHKYRLDELKLIVKATEQNGVIRNIFVKVNYNI